MSAYSSLSGATDTLTSYDRRKSPLDGNFMVNTGVTQLIECPALNAPPDLVNVPIQLPLDLALVPFSLLTRLLRSSPLFADMLSHGLLALCGQSVGLRCCCDALVHSTLQLV